MRTRVQAPPSTPRLLLIGILALATALIPAGSSAAASAASSAAPDAAPAAAGFADVLRTSTDDFVFDGFDAQFTLGRDGDGAATLHTIETLVAVFPDYDQNRGILRAIPSRYGDVETGLHIVSVTDESGEERDWTTYTEGEFTVVRIGSANAYVHGRQTYRIEYTQQHVVRDVGDVQEFYWDVNGTGWNQPFGAVSATVRFDPSIPADALTGAFSCYRGGYGDDAPADVCELDGGSLTAIATDLGPRENLTFAVAFAPGTFAQPPDPSLSWVFTVLPWVLLGGLVFVLCCAIYLRTRVWRDAKGRGIVIPQYAPPKDMHPMLAAELLGKSREALPAQILGFAVDRIVRIRVTRSKVGLERYSIELLTDQVPKKGEASIAKTLFGSLEVGKIVKLDSTNRKLGDRLFAARGREAQRVLKRELKTRPRSAAPTRLRLLLLAIAIVAIIVWWNSIDLVRPMPLVGFTALIAVVAGIVLSTFLSPPLVLTEKGALLVEHLEGLRDYVKLAETDRIRVLQGPDTAERIDISDEEQMLKLYEKVLPYAVIFGLEREWMGVLATYYDTSSSPDWYEGQRINQLPGFTSYLAATHIATTPVVTSSSGGGSSWSSSGGSSFSSGSSGGGFSGGGGGGGGGGGW